MLGFIIGLIIGANGGLLLAGLLKVISKEENKNYD